MKTKYLAGLLGIWVAATFWVSFDDLKLKNEAKDELERRAFLVYSRIFAGCMLGADYTNANYPFLKTYAWCRELAYHEKDIYLKASR